MIYRVRKFFNIPICFYQKQLNHVIPPTTLIFILNPLVFPPRPSPALQSISKFPVPAISPYFQSKSQPSQSRESKLPLTPVKKRKKKQQQTFTQSAVWKTLRRNERAILPKLLALSPEKPRCRLAVRPPVYFINPGPGYLLFPATKAFRRRPINVSESTWLGVAAPAAPPASRPKFYEISGKNGFYAREFFRPR